MLNLLKTQQILFAFDIQQCEKKNQIWHIFAFFKTKMIGFPLIFIQQVQISQKILTFFGSFQTIGNHIILQQNCHIFHDRFLFSCRFFSVFRKNTLSKSE